MDISILTKVFVTDFYKSEWPIGFLKAVLKVNISYERLWELLWHIKCVNELPLVSDERKNEGFINK